jgi:hypothetical protein
MDILKLHDSFYGDTSEIRDAVDTLDKFIATSNHIVGIGFIPTVNRIEPTPSDTPPGVEPVGAQPSSPTTSDHKVEPEGVPMPQSVMDKIVTEKQARFFNLFLHVLWNEVGEIREGQKAKIEAAHVALAEKMAEQGWQHVYLDDLDDTLPAHLTTTVGPVDPKEKSPKSDRVPVTIGVPQVDGFKSQSGEDGQSEDNVKAALADRFVAMLPEMQIAKSSCARLSKDDALKLMGESATEDVIDLPVDALYLLIDCVEEGIFNNVEITKAEMEAAAPGYAGRMFIEGHDWNDPNKAIGQVLKAMVVFSTERNKWVMRALVVVLKKNAIESFNIGLYKFVSIGASMRAVCNICHHSVQEGCPHKRGMYYDTPKGKLKCHFTGKEMMMEELSAVNVPACRPAGVIGKVTAIRAREILAASLNGGQALQPVDFVCSLHEIIYRDETKGDTPMAKWQENFRIGDAKSYVALMTQAEEVPVLGTLFQELCAKRKVEYKDAETLTFAHELMHRWFNTPTRVDLWTEDEIVAEHDAIVSAMLTQNLEHTDVSVMDTALHDMGQFKKSCASVKKEACGDVDKKEQCGEGGDDSAPMPPVEILEEENCDKGKKKVVEVSKAKLDNKILNTNGEAKPESASDDKVITGGEEKPNDEGCEGKGEELDEGAATVKVSQVTLNDAVERRAGYVDGINKAQAGAKGKELNEGADAVKGEDYKSGYQEGYKQPSKGKNHLKEQISKGGIDMVKAGKAAPVVAAEDTEKVEMAALVDVGSNEIQGELKAEMEKVNVDNVVDKDKLGEVGIEASSPQNKTDFEAGVKKEKISKDGDSFGYIKCPSCQQDNIMPDSKKCPSCGKSLSEHKEDKRMGDFPVQKTHSAYDAPPMAAKSQSHSETPKMKLSADGLADELKMVKQHLAHLDERSENERAAWSAERNDLLSERESLLAAKQQLEAEVETLSLDLQTKDAMYRTVSEENAVLASKLEKFAETEKREIVDQIVQTKLNLGLLADEDVSAQTQKYTEQSIDTLRVILAEVAGNSKAIANLSLKNKFGVPVEESTISLSSNDKTGVVADAAEAVKLEKEAKAEEKAEVKKSEGTDVAPNTIFGNIMRSLGKK